MSHIAVHRFDDVARRRLARLAQVAALPPQLERHDGKHWQLNRVPPIRGSYRQQIRPRSIELGETILYNNDVDGPATGPGNGFAEDTILGQRGFTLAIRTDVTDPTDNFRAITTPVLPWPWELVEYSIRGNPAGNGIMTFNFAAVDQVQDGSVLSARPGGDYLWELVRPTNVGTDMALAVGPWLQVRGNTQTEMNRGDGGQIGTPSSVAGKRLMFIVRMMGGSSGDGDFYATVTVREVRTARPVRLVAPAPAVPTAPAGETPWIEIY